MKAYPSRKLSRGFSVLTLSTLLGASCALAEESVVSERKTSLVFEPITVTGEKLERELKNTASSVTVSAVAKSTSKKPVTRRFTKCSRAYPT